MSSPAALPVSRLMLILPAATAPDALSALVAAGDVAALVLTGPAADAAHLAALAARAQKAGAAVLRDGPVAEAEAAGMDGVHVADPGALAGILKTLKAGQGTPLVGAGGLDSRHAAMEAGEAGADYILFGAADDADFARTCDLVGWWAELFEVPCAGLAGSLDDVVALAEAGADFVALTPAFLAGGAEAVAAAQARLEEAP